MKIAELLRENRLHLSFEVFPPKNDTVFEDVRQATEKIADLKPSFLSVTYGAGGGTSRYTLEIACDVQARAQVPALAHLTCVSSTRDTVRKQIDEMKRRGIENVMALRGDIPKDLENADRSGWDYHYAVLYRRGMLSGEPSGEPGPAAGYRASEGKSGRGLRFPDDPDVF